MFNPFAMTFYERKLKTKKNSIEVSDYDLLAKILVELQILHAKSNAKKVWCLRITGKV